MSDFISVRCIEIRQPIGTFYIGSITYSDLIRISYSDVRSMEPNNIDNYLGIQREISEKRVVELQRYVNRVDATFPTGVILAICSEDCEFSSTNGSLRIANREDVAKVIDGQHRIEGLKGFKGQYFDINITIFIDMDIEDQAMVFATINVAQTKVRKSLVYDLFELTKAPSPQKTAHNVAKLLNSKSGSPFEGRVKILGTASAANQTITQAAIVESIIPFISGSMNQAELDRDLLKRGKKLDLEFTDDDKFVFRKMFISGNDAEIAMVLWNFFSAVDKRWPEAWNNTAERGNMLPRTNGFRGLMRYLRECYSIFNREGIKLPTSEQFRMKLESVPLDDSDFTIEKFKPGTSGETQLYKTLKESLG